MTYGQWDYAWAIDNTSPGAIGEAFDCAASPDGGAVVTGWHLGVIGFGSFLAVEPAGMYGFVARFDQSGAFLWAHSISTSYYNNLQYPISCAIDPAGNTFIAGRFMATLSLDGVALLVNPDSMGTLLPYVLRFNSLGSLDWAQAVGWGPGPAYLQDMTVDAQGNVLVVGCRGDYHGALMKLDGSNGSPLLQVFATDPVSILHTVGTDTLGGIYFQGESGGPFTFGGISCPVGPGTSPEFLGKVDQNGDAQWFFVPSAASAGTVGTPLVQEHRFAVTQDGHCYALCRHSVVIGGDTIGEEPGNYGLYAVDAAGNVLWGRDLVATGLVRYSCIAAAPDGQLLAVASYWGNGNDLVEGPVFCDPLVGSTFLVARYDQLGALTGLVQGPSNVGPPVPQMRFNGFSVAALPTGEPLVCGSFMAPQPEFGPSMLTGGGDNEPFLASMGPGPLVLGTAPEKDRTALSLAPVPANALVRVRSSNGCNGGVEVFDVTARPIARTWLVNGTVELDSSTWPSGAYVARHPESGAAVRFVVSH